MFSALQGNGRVWIYTASRTLTSTEESEISEKLNKFISNWSAHGKALHAGFEIYKNQIIIIAADEGFEAASGCSIDTSVQEIRNIDQIYGLDLFNRLNIPFLKEDEIQLIPMTQINEAFQSGAINKDSLILDTTIYELASIRTGLVKPLRESWLSKKIKELAQ
ncbi:hypothetical protein GYB22_05375 [bacterium]|nr:hypothetical protein [bacterium]